MGRKRVIYKELLTPEDALSKIEKYLKLQPLGVEELDLEECLGRVLAEDVKAPINLPPFNRSRVDGYAVYSADTFGASYTNPVKLKIVGEVRAGEHVEYKVSRGEAVEVSTGASVPEGCDAVVMVEHTREEGDVVEVYKPVTPGSNVEFAGSDVRVGETICWRGTLLTPQIIGSLAACGIRRVKVYRRVKVGIISTGNELQEPGSPLKNCMIYDANSYSLHSAVKDAGCVPVRFGIVSDDYDSLKNAILKSLGSCDVTLTSGGTSAGVDDLLYRVLRDLGEPGVIVEGLNIKPGKRTIVAIVKDKLIIGLPGFPVSALMVFIHFVKPILLRLSGRLRESPVKTETVLVEDVIGEDRRLYQPVIVVEKDGVKYAYPVWGEVGSIVRMSSSDGFIVVPENSPGFRNGEVVETYLFYRELSKPDYYVFVVPDPTLHEILGLAADVLKFKLIPSNLRRIVRAAVEGHADILGYRSSILEPERIVLEEKRTVESVGYTPLFTIKREIGLVKAREGVEASKIAVISKEEPLNLLANSMKDVNVVTVKSGVEALKMLRAGDVDAILTSKIYADMWNLRFESIGLECLEISVSREVLRSESMRLWVDKVKKSAFRIGASLDYNVECGV